MFYVLLECSFDEMKKWATDSFFVFHLAVKIEH